MYYHYGKWKFNLSFKLCPEVVLFSEVTNVPWVVEIQLVLCSEVVLFSKGPVSEVPLPH